MFKNLALTALLAGAGLVGTASSASAQEPFIGEIRVFGSNFCPRGWADANGQILPIAQNSALFSLYGTMYGGDGRSTFALPDLRGRAILHEANGPGLEPTTQGERKGYEEAMAPRANAQRQRDTVRTTPTLTIRYCVALVGIYPSRN